MTSTLYSRYSRPFIICLGIIILSLVCLYLPVFQGLVSDWSSNDNYSHGFFIPVISFYMVWHMRERLNSLPVKPSNWGLLIIITGLLQLVFGYVGSEFFLKRTSFIIIISGTIAFTLGFHYLKALLVPIFYLLFMIPLPAIIWNKLAIPLQLFSTYLTEQILHLLGLAVLRQGNVLHLPFVTLEVIDACSGLRSLMSMFALSTFLAWWIKCSLWKKWLLFFSAIPIAVISNTIRLSSTAILATFYGERVVQGFFHEFSGFFTFTIGITILLLITKLFSQEKFCLKRK